MYLVLVYMAFFVPFVIKSAMNSWSLMKFVSLIKFMCLHTYFFVQCKACCSFPLWMISLENQTLSCYWYTSEAIFGMWYQGSGRTQKGSCSKNLDVLLWYLWKQLSAIAHFILLFLYGIVAKQGILWSYFLLKIHLLACTTCIH